MISHYRLTHLFVNSLIRGSRIERRRFIRKLNDLGFMRFDVNTYHKSTVEDRIEGIINEIEAAVPYGATVRVMRITDKQWTDTKVFIGRE